MPFNSPSGDLQTIYVNDYALIDQYALTGSLWTWGSNDAGQLGDGTTINRYSPVQTIAGGTNWKYAANGSSSDAAIKTDGTLWMWGSNNNGQLGDNTIANKSSPVQTIASGTNWKSVSTCGHTAAIKTDGTLWMWGQNNYGQLGDGTTVRKSSPVQTIAGGTNWKAVSCGSIFMSAIKTDGTLWLWGQNNYGQLGDNTIANKSSPVQTIAGGTNWKSVACGYIHTAAIKTDNTLWLWGYNNYGQLGDGTTVRKSSPVQTIAGGTNWKAVVAGNTNAAIKTDGTLWLWGYNAGGQLGDNTTVTKSSPVQTIAGGTNWKQVSVGGLCAAIKTDGTLWQWGGNAGGAFGYNLSSPVQTAASGTNWKSVASGPGGNPVAIYFYDANNQYPSA